jgi:short-subunit dehydrogenase
MNLSFKGKTVVVSGAGLGFGRTIAESFANLGARVFGCDILEKELATTGKAGVTTKRVDLTDRAAAASWIKEVEKETGGAVDILVNNAGGAVYQLFLDTDRARIAHQIQLNLVALTELTHRFAGAMLARGRGHVLNVASIGAYTPTPALAVYSASKAFVRDFTEALAYELRRTPVRVCCLCPGGTATEFFQASGQAPPAAVRATFMSAERCASIGLSALFGGRRNVVAGLMNKLSMFLLRFLPRRAIVRVTALVIGTPVTRGAPAPRQ